MPGTGLAVLGAGALGTALADCLARAGADVVLWGRDGAQLNAMARARENARYLPGVRLCETLQLTASLSEAAPGRVLIAAAPAQAAREMLTQVAALRLAPTPVITVAKGIEQTSGLFMCDVIARCLPGFPAAILSGPSFAQDLARGLPTAMTLACRDLRRARRLAQSLTTPTLRLYHSSDTRGVEIGGAAKNVLAIACGVSAGRGLGASAGAALLARAFAELARFGAAYGARPRTLMGLSGLGDLALTCASPQSRNYALGLALGRGEQLSDIVARGKLAEGAATAGALVALARRKGVEMPICEAVDKVLNAGGNVGAVIEALLARPQRAEI